VIGLTRADGARLSESDVEILKWGMCGLAALMFGAGIFYLIKG